jgi:tetratricopeptide (TPR) repeat protein
MLPLPWLVVLLGLLYVLVYGALSMSRREGLSLRFALESVALTGLLAGFIALTGFPVHPIAFLVVLYVVTLRVRLLVDLGNLLGRRGDHAAAARVYRLAERLKPDLASSLLVRTNQGVSHLQQGQLEAAIGVLRGVLDEAAGGFLGFRLECAAHYNLAVAYQRNGQDAQAMLEFNAVLDTWPGSEYGRRASAALTRAKQGKLKSEV